VAVHNLKKNYLPQEPVWNLMEFAPGTPIGTILSLLIAYLYGITKIHDNNGTHW